jgi:taurine dioxygenase
VKNVGLMITLKDFRINTASDESISMIRRAIFEKLIVVIKPSEDISPQDEIDFCNRIGPVQKTWNDRTKHIRGNANGILRVTGEKNDAGEPGLFGHVSALDWHCNQASNPERMPIIYLRAIKGSKGSVTSWMDNATAYSALSPNWQDRIQNKCITLGYKKGSYSESDFFNEHHAEDKPFNLLYTNRAGISGLYFPFLQIFGGDLNESSFNYLKEHCSYHGFIYDHHWEDGDIVLSEQFLTLHKRHAFEGMEHRVLHRIALDAHPL